MNQSIPQPIVNSGIPATSITPGQIASVNPLQARSALAPAGVVPLSVNPGVVPVAASTPGLAPVGGLIQSVPVAPPTAVSVPPVANYATGSVRAPIPPPVLAQTTPLLPPTTVSVPPQAAIATGSVS